MRFRAIYNCVKWGVFWDVVEPGRAHCPRHSYWGHLTVNMEIMWRWLTFKETLDDIEFEYETGNSVRSWVIA